MVFIFTAFGMYEFGQQVAYEDEESLNVALSQNNATGISGTASIGDGFELCPNLGICFLEFVNSGLRCVCVHVRAKREGISVGSVWLQARKATRVHQYLREHPDTQNKALNLHAISQIW